MNPQIDQLDSRGVQCSELSDQESPQQGDRTTAAARSSGFREMVEEIAACATLSCEEAESRLWMEVLQPGWNVVQDAARFGVTPHVYDKTMEQLYREGEGFIFETMLFWARPQRRRWIEHAHERIRLYARRTGIPTAALRILMLGDGSGSDSIFLAEKGLTVDYFDVPGSKTFEFAARRFERRGYLSSAIKVIDGYQYRQLLGGSYDAVVCFEVLEHIPDVAAVIDDVASKLKMHGIALLTEAFASQEDYLPTHLQVNQRFSGKLPSMCLHSGLNLTWCSWDPRFKPIEFRKTGRSSIFNRLRLIVSKPALALWGGAQMLRLRDFGRRLLASHGVAAREGEPNEVGSSPLVVS